MTISKFRIILLSFSITLLPVTAIGMDFYWEKTPYTRLVLSGEVVKDDGEKFRRFLRLNFEKYKANPTVRLASNGGNLMETLRIAVILRSIYPTITVEGDKCASACFFLYLSGVERRTEDSSLIGIHRAYFDPSYFKNLKLEEAKAKLTELTKIMGSILDENQVSQNLKDRLNSTSSDEIYWLKPEDIVSIGMMPGWFEELLLAKCECGAYLASQKSMWYQRPEDKEHEFDADKVAKSFWSCSTCRDKLIKEQLSVLPSTLSVKEPKPVPRK